MSTSTPPKPGQAPKDPSSNAPEAFEFEVCQSPAGESDPHSSVPATIPRPSADDPATNAWPSVPGYEILGQLGRGGMGIVYRARQQGLNRLVALKMIRACDPGLELRTRFRREAEAAARLQHPHIVQIHEIGEHGGQLFFSMELAEGGSLARKLNGAPQPAREAAALVQVLAGAVYAAHRQGIIHRDLKPANILLVSGGVGSGEWSKGISPHLSPLTTHHSPLNPKVADFGLAKWLDGDGGETQSGTILGTPAYMAPEQAGGRPQEVGVAADVYALGAILYELLTGRPPFRAATTLQTLEQVRSAEAVPPGRLQPGLPRDLDTICLKCLEKNPARRYASADDLAEELGRFLRGEPIRARPVSPLTRLVRWGRRKPAVAGLTALVAVLLVVLVLGATVSAILLKDELVRSEDAERDARDKLRTSYLDQARAARLSGQSGQRWHGLEILAEAAAIRPGTDLRDEAVACLALTDLRLAREWDGCPAGTRALAFDGQMRHWARGNERGQISVRRLADDQELRPLTGPDGAVLHLEFSPDGRFLAAVFPTPVQVQGTRLIVWDWERQLVVFRISADVSGAALAWRPDSTGLAVGRCDNLNHGCLGFYDLSTGRELRRIAVGALPRRIAFSPDGKRLAMTSHMTAGIRVYLADSDAAATELPCPRPLNGLAWRSDGCCLAATGWDGAVYTWDLPKRLPLATFGGDEAMAREVTYNHKGDLLATSGDDGTVRLWEARSGKQRVAAGGAGGPLRFSDDDRFLFTSRRGSLVGYWEVLAAPEYGLLQERRRGRRRPLAVSFSPDGRLLAVAGTNGVTLGDPVHGSISQLPVEMAGSALFDADGSSLITYSAVGLCRWPFSRSRLQVGPPAVLDTFPQSLPDRRACWVTPGRLLALANTADGEVLVLDAGNPARRDSLPPHPGLQDVSASPDGRWVATAAQDSGVRVWDRQGGKAVQTLPAFGATLAFDPKGRWLVTGTAEEYVLWQVGSWQAAHTLTRERTGQPGPSAFSPDGRLLALTPSSRTVQLLDPASSEHLALLRAPDPLVITALCFSPDGRRLAAAVENGGVQIWDLGQVRARLSALHLDWALPPYPNNESPPGKPVEMEVVSGNLSAPASPRAALAVSRCHEAHRLSDLCRFTEAVAMYREALKIATDLVRDLSLPSDRKSLAETWDQLGNALLGAGQTREAETVYRKALEVRRRLVADFPAVADYRRALSSSYFNLGNLLAAEERIAEAERLLAEALALREKLLAESARPEAHARGLDRYYHDRRTHSDTTLGTGEFDRLHETMLDSARTANNLAWLLTTSPVVRLRNLSRAVELARTARMQAPETGFIWHTLGTAEYRVGNFQAAIDAINKSMELKSRRDSFDWFVLAMAYWKLGDQERARTTYRDATEWMEKHKPHSLELRQFREEAAALLGERRQGALPVR